MVSGQKGGGVRKRGPFGSNRRRLVPNWQVLSPFVRGPLNPISGGGGGG